MGSANKDPTLTQALTDSSFAYQYWSKIWSPESKKLNMSSAGNLTALGNDVAGIAAYINILVSGKKSEAAKLPSGASSSVLGNKYFLNTGTHCKDSDNNSQKRYLYFNNIPDGKFDITASSSLSMGDYKGLVPGVLEDIGKLNPIYLLTSFTSGSSSKCSPVTLPVGNAGEPGVDPPNCKSSKYRCETRYVNNNEIKNMHSSWFDSTNAPRPTIAENFDVQYPSDMPDDWTAKLYFSTLGLLGLYIFMKLYENKD